ncbi:MAG: hypothetical protein ABFS14_09415 [Gemmatimonadota bacterium]
MTPITKTARLTGWILILTLFGGPAGAAADIVRHHLESESGQHEAHVEEPGSCADRGHACELGVCTSSPKLRASTPAAFSQAYPARDQTCPADSRLTSRGPSERLPSSRAPPTLV